MTISLSRRALPFVPGVPTLPRPDGALTRDDAHTLLTGLQAWAPAERIRCRFTADPGIAGFQSGYGYQHCAVSRRDLAAGYLVSVAGQLPAGETLETVSGVVTLAGSGDTPPAALWWLERHGTDVIVRVGSRYAQAQPGSDYAITLTFVGSGGASWQTQMPLLRCRG